MQSDMTGADHGLGALDQALGTLETSLGGAQSMTLAFGAELRRMQATMLDTGKDVTILTGGISRGLRGAFDGLIFDGQKLSDALKTVATSIANAAYSAAMRPVTDHFGGLIAQGVESVVTGLLPFARGGAFASGHVMPFARGGVVSSATAFGMRGGLGVMGEAGPEAIMPLARGPDGRLGVQSSGRGGAVNVVMNIQTPDVSSFRRSQSQIGAELGRAIQRGNRNR